MVEVIGDLTTYTHKSITQQIYTSLLVQIYIYTDQSLPLPHYNIGTIILSRYFV